MTSSEGDGVSIVTKDVTVKTCPACQRENPDVDFCEACGQYLRWENTRVGPASQPPPPAEQPREPVPTPRAAPPQPTGPPAPPAAADAVLLVLRLPGAEPAADGSLIVQVEPGGQASILALVRNQTGIVDTFELAVDGVPDGWWSIAPSLAHLLPYGVSEEGYEREVEIRFTVPRSSEAEARPWPFRVRAVSRTNGRAATATGRLAVAPFEEVESEMRPERKRGRRRARFAVATRNRGNAPVRIAFEAKDDAQACRFRFVDPEVDALAGRRAGSIFWVYPQRQRWIGRPVEHRFTAKTQVGGSSGTTRPLYGVYVQKPWLPWWLAVVAPLLAAALVAAYLLWPRTVTVPDIRQAQSPFDAARLLNQHGLELGGRIETQAAPGKVGRILDQSPAPGTEVDEGSAVTYEWGVGDEVERVPPLKGQTIQEAASALLKAGLELGAATPAAQSAQDTVTGQLPTAGELVRAGSAVDVYLKGVRPDPRPPPGRILPQDDDRPAGELIRPRAIALPDLVFDARGDLWLLKAATGKPFNLTSAPRAHNEEPALSPDGRLVAFRRGPSTRGRLFVLDLMAEKPAPRPVTADDGRDHGRPTFSPDGSVLAFASSPPDPTGATDSDLCFVSAHAPSPARPRCIADDTTDVSRPVWASDGKRILVLSKEPEGPLELAMYTSNRPSAGSPRAWSSLLPLTSGLRANDGEGQVLFASWAPDGKSIAFTASWNTGVPHLFLASFQTNGVALDAATVRELRGIRACELAWSRDDKRLAIVARDDDPVGANPCDGPGVVWWLDPDRPKTLHAVTGYRTGAANPVWRPRSDRT